MVPTISISAMVLAIFVLALIYRVARPSATTWSSVLPGATAATILWWGINHNVVFTCGAVLEPNGTVKIYWGGADTVMCMGEANVSELVALCLENGRPAK